MSTLAMATKSVLVSLEDRTRVVSFTGDRQELLLQVESTFSDVLMKGERVFLQILCTSGDWEGNYVELLDGDEIPHKSKIKAVAYVPRSTPAASEHCSVPSASASSTIIDLSKTVPQSSVYEGGKQLRLGAVDGAMTVKPASVEPVEVINLSEDMAVEEERVKELAVIYKKETSRPLSKYQLAMNKAAQYLCVQQPSLLRKRQMLIERAREKLFADGFEFVKGKSRSKKLSDSDSEPKTKRPKLCQEIRDKRLAELEQDISDLKERVSYKEKRIAERLNIRDYKKCDEIKEEVMGLRKQLREAEQELKHVSKSSHRSLLYKRKRQTSSSGSDTSKATTPAPAESTASSDGSTIILTPSPSSDVVPNSQYTLFSPPHSPASPNDEPQLHTEPGTTSDVEEITPNNATQNLI